MEVHKTLVQSNLSSTYIFFSTAMLIKGREVKGLKKHLATTFKAAAVEYHLGGGRPSTKYNLGKKMFYGKVKEALGLDQCRLFFTGAAPISMETLQYFLGIDVVIQQLYGLSETVGRK